MNQLKRVLIHFSLVIIALAIYFLESNFFSWFTIAGIKPNLYIIFVLFIGIFGNRMMGTVYGALIGLFIDFIFNEKIGPNLVGLALIGMLATIFDRNFSKDSRITVMFMVLGATIIFEVLIYLMNIMLYSINIEILQFIKILAIEIAYNIIITIIIYPLMQKFGYYIENEYKGNRILTRYF